MNSRQRLVLGTLVAIGLLGGVRLLSADDPKPASPPAAKPFKPVQDVERVMKSQDAMVKSIKDDLLEKEWENAETAAWILAELANVREQAELTHLVHRQRIHLATGPTAAATVGCFSYALAGSDHVRLHFNAGDHLLESPLSLANRAVRQVELAILLSQLKETAGENVHVVGASWLYNLDCYRRLFPEAYLASLQVVNHPYQRMPLWGQFLNRDRSVRSEGGSRFLATVAKACSLPELALCFPFPVLSTTAPARWFHDHVSQ